MGQNIENGFDRPLVSEPGVEVQMGDTPTSNDELEVINRVFNEELQMQIDGKLRKGHVYNLGNPNEILQLAGFPDIPLELDAASLVEKSDISYKNSHPFDLSDVRDLPKAVHFPIMVFDSKTKNNSKVILTALKSKEINFVVAVEINREGKYHKADKINSVRSLYPKDQELGILN